MQGRGQLLGVFLADRAFSVLHLGKVPPGNAGCFCKLILCQLFTIADTFQIAPAKRIRLDISCCHQPQASYLWPLQF